MTALSLEDIGWNSFFQAQLAPLAGEYQLDAAADDPARVAPYRVVIEYQDRYRLLGADGYAWGQMTGNLLRAAMDDRFAGDYDLIEWRRKNHGYAHERVLFTGTFERADGGKHPRESEDQPGRGHHGRPCRPIGVIQRTG